jgi:hypothetical protein
MGGGGVRSEETGQLAGWTRGTKGDGRNDRCRQMGGGGVRRGNATTSRTTVGLEGQDEWPESSVDTANDSLMVRYSATAPRRQWMERWLLNSEGWRDGSSTVRDSSTAPRWRGTARDGSSTARDGDGLRAQRRWAAMNSAMANGR